LSLLDRVHGVAVRRGVLGRSQPWLAIAIATWGARFARRLIRKDEAVVLRETLRPGETLVITHTPETYGSRTKSRRSKRSR
jgi:hypothetical protein